MGRHEPALRKRLCHIHRKELKTSFKPVRLDQTGFIPHFHQQTLNARNGWMLNIKYWEIVETTWHGGLFFKFCISILSENIPMPPSPHTLEASLRWGWCYWIEALKWSRHHTETNPTKFNIFTFLIHIRASFQTWKCLFIKILSELPPPGHGLLENSMLIRVFLFPHPTKAVDGESRGEHEPILLFIACMWIRLHSGAPQLSDITQ